MKVAALLKFPLEFVVRKLQEFLGGGLLRRQPRFVFVLSVSVPCSVGQKREVCAHDHSVYQGSIYIRFLQAISHRRSPVIGIGLAMLKMLPSPTSEALCASS